MREAVVIDTNVPIVANGDHENASTDCVLRCIDTLVNARDRSRMLLDDSGLIFEEYSRGLSRGGQPGVGHAFFKWLWDNQANEVVCRKVTITPNPTREFDEFPDDARLSRFDRSDRKFVAVALASPEPAVVVNASDNDWAEFADALHDCGVRVRFLCPDLIGRGPRIRRPEGKAAVKGARAAGRGQRKRRRRRAP